MKAYIYGSYIGKCNGIARFAGYVKDANKADGELAKLELSRKQWEETATLNARNSADKDEIIAQLRAELDKEIKFACEMRASREGWKNTAETATARAMELRAALDEARELLETVRANREWTKRRNKWLEAHPEEK